MGSQTERHNFPIPMRPPRATMKPRAGAVRGRVVAAATLAGITLVSAALAGCGEVTNTIAPRAGSANQVTVELAGPPNAFYAGIYEAQALGYFAQTDIDVRLVLPAAGQDPITMVHDKQVLIAIGSEPNLLLHRNANEPVVAVAALVHGPLSAITVHVPKAGPSGGSAVATTSTGASTTTAAGTTTGTSSTTTGTTTTFSQPDTPLLPAALQQLLSQPNVPTYDSLVAVVRKATIVQHAPLIRRFVQAVARGYQAARANPAQAIKNLVAAVPTLGSSKALQLATLKAAIPSFFPAGDAIWGWQSQAQWNTFGTWMMNHHLLSNPNAITDASTNELLQGEGV
jgi:putative hydroxymethylpyrimidine transport system substrate-binding protein